MTNSAALFLSWRKTRMLGSILRGASPAENLKKNRRKAKEKAAFYPKKRDLRQKSRRHNDLCCGVGDEKGSKMSRE